MQIIANNPYKVFDSRSELSIINRQVIFFKEIMSLLIISISLIQNINAQEEVVTFEYSEETTEWQEPVHYLSRAMVEETSLIKFSPTTFWKNEQLGFFGGFRIAYERKLNPSVSLLIESHNRFNTGGSTGRISLVKSPSNEEAYDLDTITYSSNFYGHLDIAMRYYFLLKNKIFYGESGNNFSSFFIEGRINNFVPYNPPSSPHPLERDQAYSYNGAYLTTMIGFQKRIGEFGFFDGGVGIGLGDRIDSNKSIGLKGMFSLGLAYRLTPRRNKL